MKVTVSGSSTIVLRGFVLAKGEVAFATTTWTSKRGPRSGSVESSAVVSPERHLSDDRGAIVRPRTDNGTDAR